MWTAFDLFAGAGGMSTGLELAGFSVLYANEVMPVYAQTLTHNHPETEVDVRDIREVEPSEVVKRHNLRRGELDLLAGGPPCQGFSINAPIRATTDERNHLFWSYLRFVEATYPKVVLIENVPGIVSYENGDVVESILSKLKEIGYQATLRILFAAHYGVPQMRWRTIFIGIRHDVAARQNVERLFPAPTHTARGRANFRQKYKDLTLVMDAGQRSSMNVPGVNVSDAISDLPMIENGGGCLVMEYGEKARTQYQTFLRKDSNLLHNHQCAGLGKANLVRLPYIPQGGSWRDIPHDLLPLGMQRARRSDHTKRYGRLDPNDIGSTILTKCDPHWGTFIHPDQDRIISVREAARIQSFPDRVVFTGNLTEQYEQVGNAVPPLLSKAIGQQIKGLLAGDIGASSWPTTGCRQKQLSLFQS